MDYPPLVVLDTEDDYRSHYEALFCRKPIVTCDGIEVRFRKRDFDHAFFESVLSKDDTFSRKRAERMDWIKAALQDPSAERFVGWNQKRNRYDHRRHVIVVQRNYVVVVVITGKKSGKFITAYVADTPARPGRASTIDQIRGGPKWT